MNHPSDLALERALDGESVPQLSEHLGQCDACWTRWSHLHDAEGRSLPVRPRPPAANGRWTVGLWGIAAAVLLTSLATGAGAWVVSGSNESAETRALQEEVAALQVELEQQKQSRARKPEEAGVPGGGASLSPDRQVSGAASAGPSRVTEAGPAVADPAWVEAQVDAEIERRELAKLEQAREGVARKTERKVVETLDALVEKRLLTAEQADEVELVLLDEFDQTWEIKADAGLGHLTGEEAYEDYLALREQTDEQLQALLGEAGLESVRRAFDGK